MKIAFWGNTLQKANVSSHLAAISIATVTHSQYKVIAFENHFCKHDLGNIFRGSQAKDSILREVGCNYYEGVGLEGLIRQIYRSNNQLQHLPTYTNEIIQDHLYYIPQNRIIHQDLFDYEFNQSIGPLLNKIEGYADLCFIDTASNNSLSTKIILEEADLIVVNFSQSTLFLDEFFSQYSSLISKSVFLIGNFTSHSLLAYKRVARNFNIPWYKMCMIPKSNLFQDAYLQGNVVEFMKVNYGCTKENDNYPFIQAIKKATAMILKELVNKSDGKVSVEC